LLSFQQQCGQELQFKAQEAAARKALAEAEALELANLEKKGFRITLKKIL